jgi:hypothetical protein
VKGKLICKLNLGMVLEAACGKDDSYNEINTRIKCVKIHLRSSSAY